MTESGGGEGHPGAKADSRVRIRARRLARSGDSPCHHRSKPQARSSWANAEDGEEPRWAVGPHAGPGHHCPQPPESHRAPARSMQGGGSRLALVALATRGPPTDRQPDGGQSPGAPSRRRGKPSHVEHRADQRRSQSLRRVQRHGVIGFPARGVARAAQNGRRGAPLSFGTRAASRRPSCRPTVQGRER